MSERMTPKPAGKAKPPSSVKARKEAVFGKGREVEAKYKEAPKLDPKLKKRVKAAIKKMYDLIGREPEGEFEYKLGGYKVTGVNYGKSTRGISFSKGKDTLHFSFEISKWAMIHFNRKEVANYTPHEKSPNRYSNVKLLAKKLEDFSKIMEGRFKKVEDF